MASAERLTIAFLSHLRRVNKIKTYHNDRWNCTLGWQPEYYSGCHPCRRDQLAAAAASPGVSGIAPVP